MCLIETAFLLKSLISNLWLYKDHESTYENNNDNSSNLDPIYLFEQHGFLVKN